MEETDYDSFFRYLFVDKKHDKFTLLKLSTLHISYFEF